jgi:hypothetical protein
MFPNNLTDENLLSFALKAYTIPHYIDSEFYSDLNRVKYIKKLVQRYRSTGVLKERLILNHLIMLYNVFDTELCTRMLFLKFRVNDYPVLKTFLLYLGYMPKMVKNVKGKDILSDSIRVDEHINSKLKVL